MNAFQKCFHDHILPPLETVIRDHYYSLPVEHIFFLKYKEHWKGQNKIYKMCMKLTMKRAVRN